MDPHDHVRLAAGIVPRSSPRFEDLVAKHIVVVPSSSATLRIVDAKLRTKKAIAALRRWPLSFHVATASRRGCNGQLRPTA